eukprot:3583298-Pleurochrysis_carterae.AAC.4
MGAAATLAVLTVPAVAKAKPAVARAAVAAAAAARTLRSTGRGCAMHPLRLRHHARRSASDHASSICHGICALPLVAARYFASRGHCASRHGGGTALDVLLRLTRTRREDGTTTLLNRSSVRETTF